jgi:hypothetical protein
MTESQILTEQAAEAEVQARLKDMEEENQLLLLQLHQVQEELERYFLKCQKLEKGGGSTSSGSAPVGGWVDDDMPALQAEVFRLTALVETQTRLHEIEAKNALNARLGDVLIQSVSPSGSIVGLPAKLLGIWRASKAVQPSAALGGKNFGKVIEVFQTGGLESVNQLLAKELAPEMRAKAYTALARYQMTNGLLVDAVLSARRAYEEEPKPYRLKWLAFRLHDAGEIAEADACLELLPLDTPFSDSEARQRDQVSYEARSVRLREAKQKTGYDSRRQAIETQMQTLRRDSEKHARQVAERQEEIKSLQQALAQLEKVKSDIALQQEGSARLAAERQGEIETLRQALDAFEQEKTLLAAQQEELATLAAERQGEIESLRQALDAFEQEKTLLAAQQEKSAKLAAERQGEIETLRQALDAFEQEKTLLVAQQEESARLAAERQKKIASLNQAAEKVEQERAAFIKSIEELTRHRDDQSRLAQDRALQIEELQRKAQERAVAESELSIRQEMIREEMVRAEAQLDLLKEILLKEPGL